MRAERSVPTGGAAVGKAMAGVGDQVTKLGLTIQDKRDEVDEFDTERRYQEFKWNQAVGLDEAVRQVQPGQAGNFADNWTGSYAENARQFFETIPEHLKRQYDNKLFAAERSFYGQARTFERGEQKRFALQTIDDRINATALLGRPDEARTDLDTLITKHPFLDDIEKDEVRHKAFEKLDALSVDARLRGDEDNPVDVLDDLRGGFDGRRADIERHSDGMATVKTAAGAKFRVAGDYADRFAGAIADLEAEGVVPKGAQSGGYAKRNIAGTNKPSEHAFGRAIDINWQENARGSKGKIDPEVARAVAKKWGLTWGGDWDNPDPMHFEIDPKAAPEVAAPPVSERGMTQYAGLDGKETASDAAGARLPGKHPYLSAEKRLVYMDQARAKIERLKKERERDIEGVEQLAGEGFEPPAEAMAKLEAEVGKLRDPELAQKLERARGLQELMTSVRQARPAEVEAFVRQERDKLKTQGATIESQKLLKAVDTLNTSMRTELNKDALSWAARVGKAEVAPLNLDDPTMLAERVKVAHEVADYYGQAPQFFTEDERETVKESLKAGGDEMLATLSKITGSLGPDDSLVAIQEVGKDLSEAASIGWLLTTGGSSEAIKDAAAGMTLRQAEGFQSVAPSARDAQAAAVDELGGALAAYPRSEVAAINTANLLYEVRARSSGETSFNANLWKQGLRQAIGEEEVHGITYGGIVSQGWFGANPIVLPPTLRQDGLEEAIDTIAMLDLDEAGLGRPVGATGKPIELSRLKSGTLVQVGDGRYAIATGDPNVPGGERWVFKDRPGQLFELDFTKLTPRLMKRRRDLFKGGR